MKPNELYDLIDGLAPFSLSREMIERGYRDNSGLLVDCGKNIKGILFSLDLSFAAIEEAKKTGANCIVTHHPAIWDAVMQINSAMSPKLTACIGAGISVLSAHLNLDAAENGIDAMLMRGLGGKESLSYEETLTGGAYGRVYDIKETSMRLFAEKAGQIFHTKRVLAYGVSPVKRVASFCGGGFDADAIDFAVKNGADTIVSSDAKHHFITEAVECGLNLLFLTHYAAENYGFVRFAEAVKPLVKVPVTTFTDERFL